MKHDHTLVNFDKKHIGFGTYRVVKGNPAHERALQRALERGIRLIDCSANYGDGNAERLVGAQVADLVASHALYRRDLHVVTKGGYIQGSNLHLARARRDEGRPYPEVVEYASNLWHCIHPEFLADQLSASLERLGLHYLDTYLLHNPEYFLSFAHRQGQNLFDARTEFYKRIRHAFAYLESEVDRGRIRNYGISSNSFPTPSDDPEHCSLDTCFEIARELGGDSHRFRVVQFPFNLLEHGAATTLNQAENSRTLVERITDYGLQGLVNRPVNAIVGNTLVRLADSGYSDSPPEPVIEEHVVAFAQLESELRGLLQEATRSSHDVPNRDAMILANLEPIGPQLREHWSRLHSYARWSEIRDYTVRPQLSVLKNLAERNDISVGVANVDDLAGSLIDSLNRWYGTRQDAHHAAMKPRLARLLQTDITSPFSQIAIACLLETQGVNTVLVGARRENYVDDAIRASLLSSVQLGRQDWHLIASIVAGS